MAEQEPTIAEDWFHQSFDSLYPIVYAHRTIHAAKAEALFSVKATHLTKRDTVLDLCCGNGRHMAHLMSYAGRVAGLDYSPHLLEMARQFLGPESELVRGDMRSLPFDGVFDAIFNYFTSFGYFQTDAENLAVVEGVARSLKHDGRFFIDYLNRSHTERNLQPSSIRNHEGYEIREERWIDVHLHRINKTTKVVKEGRAISEMGESVKLYTANEFSALLAEGGLIVDSVYGDYDGAAWDEDAPRMIVVGRKA